MQNSILKKNVVLIQPSEPFHPMAEMPLSIIGLASILQEAGYNVEILDARIRNLSVLETIEIIKRKNPDIIGITGLVNSYRYIKNFCNECKRVFPELPIVAGGCFIRTQPEIILPKVPIDVAVIGEGEEIIVELFSRLINKENLDGIANIAYLDENDKIIKSEIKDVEDFNRFPFPAYELLDISLYLTSNDGTNQFYFPITTGRGCVNHCYYCGRPTNKVRRVTPERLLEHWDFLHEKYGISAFLFSEDSGLFPEEWIINFCKLKCEKKRDYIFGVAGCPDQMTDEVAHWLSKAGCTATMVAVEHWNPIIQSGFFRKKQSKKIFDALNIIQKHNLMNAGFNILWGHPDDTVKSFYKSFKKSIKVVKQFAIPNFSVATLVIYPNSKLHKDALKMGKIKDYEDYLYCLGGYGPYVNLTKENDSDFVSIIQKIKLDLEIEYCLYQLKYLILKEFVLKMRKKESLMSWICNTVAIVRKVIIYLREYIRLTLSNSPDQGYLYNPDINAYHKIGCFEELLTTIKEKNIVVYYSKAFDDENWIRLFNSIREANCNFMGFLVDPNGPIPIIDEDVIIKKEHFHNLKIDYIVAKKSDNIYLKKYCSSSRIPLYLINDNDFKKQNWNMPSLTAYYNNMDCYSIQRYGNDLIRERNIH